jgi:hypothetical protein
MNLHSFLVRAKKGSAIFAYPAMNLLSYLINLKNALTFVAVLV